MHVTETSSQESSSPSPTELGMVVSQTANLCREEENAAATRACALMARQRMLIQFGGRRLGSQTWGSMPDWIAVAGLIDDQPGGRFYS